MSIEAANAFRSQVDQSDELKGQLQQLRDVTHESLAQFAREQGYDVSAEDLATLADDMELSEWEMTCVAGGSSPLAGFLK